MPLAKDAYIEDLIGDGHLVHVKCPPALYNRLVELGRRRYGNLEKPLLVSKAIVYSAALGTLSWSGSYNKSVQTTRRRGRVAKIVAEKKEEKAEAK